MTFGKWMNKVVPHGSDTEVQTGSIERQIVMRGMVVKKNVPGHIVSTRKLGVFESLPVNSMSEGVRRFNRAKCW
jgi:hypothetical protein